MRSAGEADTVRLGGWDGFGGSAAGTEREDKKASMTNRRMRRSEDRGCVKARRACCRVKRDEVVVAFMINILSVVLETELQKYAV